MMDGRSAAIAALLRIQEQGGYSNIVLEELLSGEKVTDPDRALASRLLYGVTERRLTLDYLLNKTSSTPVKKMQPAVREILRVGVYQLVYMDKTPAFAAIHEAVEQTKRMGYARLSGFVNGVLRQVQRQYEALLSALPLTDKGVEIQYSVPRAWIRHWREAYGEEVLQGLLSSLNEAPPSYIRVNTCATSTAAFCDMLDGCGILWQPVAGLPDALVVLSPADLRNLPEDFQTQYYFQDLASQWCCEAIHAHPGERVVDVCAAPGGKTMTVAQYMHNTGSIVAGDVHEHKCRGLRERTARYGFSCISVCRWDASQPPAAERMEAFDRVVCDVPCSGLGVIRRKPEIRYKAPEEFAELPALQLQILEQAAKMVRPGGFVHYSTCTLRPEENEQVVAAFLQAHPEFAPQVLPLTSCFERLGCTPSHQITLFPHIHGTDGFFLACLRRKED